MKTAAVVRTVTLQVTPKQAQTLNVAMAMGDLSVSLRSLALDEDPDEDRTFTTDLQVSPTLAYALPSAGNGGADRQSKLTPRPMRRVPGQRAKRYPRQ